MTEFNLKKCKQCPVRTDAVIKAGITAKDDE